MSKRDVDLEELLAFQKAFRETCVKVTEQGQKLRGSSKSAEGMLRDSVSKKTIQKIDDLAEYLIMLGNKGQELMNQHIQHTTKELEAWQALLGGAGGGGVGAAPGVGSVSTISLNIQGNSGGNVNVAGGAGSSVELTPMQALTDYMCAHNYGIDDYDTYSQDPEWQALHAAVFPSFHQVTDHEMTKEEKIDWVSSVLPDAGRAEVTRITESMEFYSGNGYSPIHWDSKAELQETRDILRVFDGHNVASFEGTIHRGLSFDSEKEIMHLLKKSRGVWTEPGITSFSADKKVAEQFASDKEWGLVLTCTNNKTAIPFRHMSKLSFEDEVLSPGGHRNNGWIIDKNSIVIDRVKKKIYAYIYER